MTLSTYNYPLRLWQCLAAERLNVQQHKQVVLWGKTFALHRVKLEVIEGDLGPVGIAAYAQDSTAVASVVRQWSDPRGMYRALHRLHLVLQARMRREQTAKDD